MLCGPMPPRLVQISHTGQSYESNPCMIKIDRQLNIIMSLPDMFFSPDQPALNVASYQNSFTSFIICCFHSYFYDFNINVFWKCIYK